MALVVARRSRPDAAFSADTMAIPEIMIATWRNRIRLCAIGRIPHSIADAMPAGV
jgi:hypothetical protein